MATKKGSTPVRSDYHNAYFQAITLKRGHVKSFTGSAANSAIIDENTSIVKLFPTQDCWIKVGPSGSTTAASPADATAVDDSTFLPGGIIEYIGIPENITNPVISVISNGTNGSLYITEGE